MDQLNSDIAEVVINKGDSPEESVLDGIEKLGGISKFIDDGDQVFIKFNLRLPFGFPTNTNLDTIKAIVQLCNQAGAKKVYVGGFPMEGLTVKAISDSLGLKDYFKNIGAELVFLDSSDLFSQRGIDTNKLKAIKKRAFEYKSITNDYKPKIAIYRKYGIPKIILESDKLISINQVNVDPIFKVRLSLFNLYSLIPNRYQKIENKLKGGREYLLKDKYKQDLASKIIDVYSIKKPSLVVNDLFYILEGAGPLIYKDSNLKKTGIVVIGSDAIAVDSITLKLLNLDPEHDILLSMAKKRNIGVTELSKIRIIGENLENIKINVENCIYKLEDINLRNFSIKMGQFCSGCFEQAYHLLNFMKTNMIKDLKYLSHKNSLLIGDNPLKSEDIDNDVIIFGNCAIRSTKNHPLRKNKKVMELFGCPPNLFNSIELLLKMYNKDDIPMLSLFEKLYKYYRPKNLTEKLEKWEGL
ncbi:MAG: DUF362 domain-containing protein [Promethearchaeota archaeon]